MFMIKNAEVRALEAVVDGLCPPKNPEPKRLSQKRDYTDPPAL